MCVTLSLPTFQHDAMALRRGISSEKDVGNERNGHLPRL